MFTAETFTLLNAAEGCLSAEDSTEQEKRCLAAIRTYGLIL
jgi:hypothetical protein